MKFLANLIVRSNEWYENLPKFSGEMFYLGLVFIPYMWIVFGLAILVPSKTGILGCSLGLLWVLLVCLWRVSFSYIKERRKLKK
jgi:hypothetical protein